MILTRNLHMFQDILEPKVENKNVSLEKNAFFLKFFFIDYFNIKTCW